MCITPRPVTRLSRLLAVALLALLWRPAAVTAAPQVSADSAIIAAELALQRGDCAAGSREYVSAASASSDAKVASRAAEVAIDCGQYVQAAEAAARWRALTPGDSAPLLFAVRSELGRARVTEARRRVLDWLNSRPAPDDAAVAKGILEIAGTTGAEITFATFRDIQHARLNGKQAQVALAELAADAFDYAQSLKYAQGAEKAGIDARALSPLRVRALAGKGNAEQALAAAKELANDDPEQGLVEVETLIGIGRESEAESLLQRLREDPQLSVQATRRLAMMAFAKADYATAEQLFAELVTNRETVGLAVYYLAVISERRGDVDSAMKGYELLARSGFDDGARRRVAGLYMRDGERLQAIRLLSPDDDAGPRERIGAELEIAGLLAEGGSPKDAVARIDSALQGAPGHPDLSYQRSVYLERIDPAAAIESLEALRKQRPQDMTIINALGFTLADHGRDLPRAEQLIREALRVTPDNPAVLDSLGWVLFKRGKPAEAKPYLQRAWRMFHDGDIGAHYGEVLWTLGLKDEARAQWRTALAADPDNQALLQTAQKYAPEISVPVPQPRSIANVIGGTAI